LLDVLQTIPDQSPTIEPENECEPAELRFRGGASDLVLSHIHRFVRLWRRTGWTMRELDRALAVFARQAGDPATLQGLALVRLLCEGLGVSPLVVAGILGALETEAWTPNEPEGAVGEPSLYHTLFQQNALRASASYPSFTLASGRTLSA